MDITDEVEVTDGLIISNHRCVFDRSTGTLAIGDLHLGYEGAAKYDGVYFPRVQKKVIMKELELILGLFSPKRVVVNGDLKHTFDRNLYQEWEEIKEVLGLLSEEGREVHIVRGNHDNFISGILPKGTDLPLELNIGRTQFTHGHKKGIPVEGREKGKVLVLGHEHPSVRLRDKIGASVRLTCFLYHSVEQILILQAFSRITKGSNVMSRGFLSSLLKDFEPGEFMAYAVSEIGLMELGVLGDLYGPELELPYDRIP